MNPLSSLERQALIEEMTHTPFDLLVIGGGITGAGILLDAAARGLKVGLVEKYDFASGTSSRSTKLIHGGLRYLKQFEIQLVREVGRERAIVHRLAPHLVVSEKMLLPIIEGGTFGKILTSFGLMVYDVLAGVESVDQRTMLSKEETLKEEPLLDETHLKGGGLYAEYRTDDARLTIEVLKTASHHGGLGVNYVEVVDFLYDAGKVVGVQCMDRLSGKTLEVRAKYVVSAAGPWVDELRDKNGSLSGKRLHLTKGVHIVIPHEKLPIHHSVYFDVADGRMIFAIPRNQVTYVGTTDTDYHGDLDHVITLHEDAQYLIDAVNDAFPSIDLRIEDIISSWAGLRPLIHEEGKSASELSRKDEIFESSNGLLSIAGGKLTGYRKMAERIIDMVAKKIKQQEDRKLDSCKTDTLVLTGGGFKDAKAVRQYRKVVEEALKPYGFSAQDADYLVSNYGLQTDLILEKLRKLSEEDAHLGLLKAELWFAVQHEMIHGALDFFGRRTGRLYFDIDSVKKYGDPILTTLGEWMGWDSTRLNTEKEELKTAVSEAHIFPPQATSKHAKT